MTSQANSHLTDYLEGFQRYLATAVRLSEITQKKYAYEVKAFALKIGDPIMAAATPRMLLDWNASLQVAGISASYAGQKHAALKKFFTYLEQFEGSARAGSLLKVLRNQIQPPLDQGPAREPYVLERAPFEQMLAALGAKFGTGSRDRAIMHFLYSSGVRNSELTGLTLDQLDLAERVAVVLGKGKKERLVVIDEPCRQDLAAWLKDRAAWDDTGDYVFCSVMGRRLSTGWVDAIIGAAPRLAGLKLEVWPHVFRHTRVTQLLNNGMTLQETAVMAGHSDVKTTMRYYHQEPSMLKHAYDQATKKQSKEGG